MKKKLYRSKTDVKISGVCAGLGEYFGVDTTLIRLAWILVTLITAIGFGVVMYIACVCIIPTEPDLIEGEYEEKDIL